MNDECPHCNGEMMEEDCLKKRLDEAEATLKSIQALEHISIGKVRAIQDLNPELAKSEWVLYSSESTDKYPTLDELIKEQGDE